MPKSNIINALEELDKKDIYSLILFVLYQMKEKPEYSTLSELTYILDNESFIRFLNYFGGQTITVPKIEELKDVLDALCYYERKMNTELSDKEIFEELNIKKKNESQVLKTAKVITDIVENYNFKRNYRRNQYENN